MACPKCGRRFSPQPANTYQPPPVAPSQSPTPVPKIVGVMNTRRNADKVCEKCGWMYKKIRYIDVKTRTIVEKFCCSNRSCENFQA